MTQKSHQQPYDNLLKRLLEGQYTAIIPLLFGKNKIEILEELTVEMLIPPRRGDRVYKVIYKDEIHILHFEFEASGSGKMDKRLLVYHALLLEKYGLPVISMIIYPFKVTIASSPLKETNADGEILSFSFRVLQLWEQDARQYIRARAIPFYGLLPAMSEITDDLLLQAIEDMLQYYSGNDDLLRDELLCFKILLQRAERLPAIGMERVLRRIRMIDPLLEQDPWIQELRAKDRKEGQKEGRAEGQLNSTRDMLVNIVHLRFPTLTNLAEKRAQQIDQPEILTRFIQQIVLATDANVARAVLESQPRL